MAVSSDKIGNAVAKIGRNRGRDSKIDELALNLKATGINKLEYKRTCCLDMRYTGAWSGRLLQMSSAMRNGMYIGYIPKPLTDYEMEKNP